MKVEDIIAALPSLTAEDRRKIQTALSFLGSAPVQYEAAEQRIYDALCREFREMGGEPPPLGAIKRWSKPLHDGAPFLMTYLKTHLQVKDRREEQKALGILWRMVIRRLKEKKVPVTVVNLLRQLPNIPSYVDDQFPGYRESGVLRLIVTR